MLEMTRKRVEKAVTPAKPIIPVPLIDEVALKNASPFPTLKTPRPTGPAQRPVAEVRVRK